MTLACRFGKSILKTRWGCHLKNRSRIFWRLPSGASGASGGGSGGGSGVPTIWCGVVWWCGASGGWWH